MPLFNLLFSPIYALMKLFLIFLWGYFLLLLLNLSLSLLTSLLMHL